MYLRGYTEQEIAELVGKPRATVQGVLTEIANLQIPSIPDAFAEMRAEEEATEKQKREDHGPDRHRPPDCTIADRYRDYPYGLLCIRSLNSFDIPLTECIAMLHNSSMEKERAVQVTFRVGQTLARRFKAQCALVGRDQSDVFRELMNRWVMERERETSKK